MTRCQGPYIHFITHPATWQQRIILVIRNLYIRVEP